jgi:PAS domain S-box-containing protein
MPVPAQLDPARPSDEPSLHHQLIDRLRFILAIIVTMASAFCLVEIFTASHSLGLFFALRVLGALLAFLGFLVLRRPWAEPLATPLAVAIVTFAYVFVALTGLVSPTGEYATTAFLFVGAALMTATVLPWGLGPQCLSVAVGALALAAVIRWTDGSFAAFTTDPAAAVMMGFILSGVIAREFERYRTAHRRELEERRRAETEVRELNAALERRVMERTAALHSLNDRLAAEVAVRQRANEQLRSSERLLADTVDHSSAVVSLKDIGGGYLLVNHEFERLFGHPRETAIGCRDEDLFTSEIAALLKTRDGEVLASGEPVSFEQDLPLGDGTRRYVCVKFPLHGADGAPYGVGSMSTDITALNQLQEELRRHQDELARVLRLHTIDEMTAAVAHEINQPLCAISNYARGAVQRLRNGEVDTTLMLGAFDRIATEALRAGEILRGIRGLIRRENEEDTSVDVRALAGEAVQVLEPQARQHGVTVRLEDGEALPPVRGNPTQIEQVMVNLILNGVQAAATDHGVREVVIATTRSGDSVEVAVSDSGSGVPADLESKLFSPFFTTKPRGLGLGLAISRTIVENHGGQLWTASKEKANAGATFCFSLPLAAVRHDAPPRAFGR